MIVNHIDLKVINEIMTINIANTKNETIPSIIEITG